MAHKQFKIGEYAIGGIIDITINKNELTIKALDWDTKETLMGRIFDANGVDSWHSINEWLHELTSSYYADKCMEYIEKHISFTERAFGW
jgi:hypothetical protein